MELCTKLSDKVTSLEEDLKQAKRIYGKALTKLVKKVKLLEAKLKSTTERRKARMVIFDDEEDLVSEDTSKQGRMTETEYEEFEIVHRVSSTRGHDIYMLIEKDYPLSTTVMNLMLSRRLQVYYIEKKKKKDKMMYAKREISQKKGKVLGKELKLIPWLWFCGVKEGNLMMTALHTVAAIFCVKCGSVRSGSLAVAVMDSGRDEADKSVELKGLLPSCVNCVRDNEIDKGISPLESAAKIQLLLTALEALCVQYKVEFRTNVSIVAKALQPPLLPATPVTALEV
ncbi:hypothetical protein Tco_0360773 [Tanacetum coccineum]